jgi:hypothetical protein
MLCVCVLVCMQISLSGNEPLKRKCTVSLLRLSANPKLQSVIVQAGAVEALCNMYSNSDIDIKSGCVESLCNLIAVRSAFVLFYCVCTCI